MGRDRSEACSPSSPSDLPSPTSGSISMSRKLATKVRDLIWLTFGGWVDVWKDPERGRTRTREGCVEVSPSRDVNTFERDIGRREATHRGAEELLKCLIALEDDALVEER